MLWCDVAVDDVVIAAFRCGVVGYAVVSSLLLFAVSLMMLLYYVAVVEVVKIRLSIQFSFVWKHLSQVLCWRNFARGRHNEISACVGDFLSKKKIRFFQKKKCFLFFSLYNQSAAILWWLSTFFFFNWIIDWITKRVSNSIMIHLQAAVLSNGPYNNGSFLL